MKQLTFIIFTCLICFFISSRHSLSFAKVVLEIIYKRATFHYSHYFLQLFWVQLLLIKKVKSKDEKIMAIPCVYYSL